METVAAVDRLVTARLERHFCRAAAAAAGRAEHFPLTAAAATAAVKAGSAAAAAFGRFTRRATVGAPAWLVLESLLGVEFLLAGSERKLLAAIHASNKLIGIHLG